MFLLGTALLRFRVDPRLYGHYLHAGCKQYNANQGIQKSISQTKDYDTVQRTDGATTPLLFVMHQRKHKNATQTQESAANYVDLTSI